MLTVPLLDMQAQYQPLRDAVIAAMVRVLDSGTYILGPEVEELERRIAEYTGAKYAIGVSSGTDALLVALMALDLGPGDEVVTTNYSFFATAGCISRLGARPVFVDIDLESYNLATSQLEAAITPRTKAIIPVHLFGQTADMGPILELAERHHLAVVEDAAQALGAQYRDGRHVGTLGALGCYSFFPSKNLGCLGDGGMVVTNDRQLADKVKILRAHGSKPKYYHKVIGGNFRLDALQAAVLNAKLASLDSWAQGRQRHAAYYRERLQGHPHVSLPTEIWQSVASSVPGYHVYNQFVIRSAERDRVQATLEKAGIGTAIYYPVPFHRQECFASLQLDPAGFPASDTAAQQSLAIPVYPELTAEQLQYVADTLWQTAKRED